MIKLTHIHWRPQMYMNKVHQHTSSYTCAPWVAHRCEGIVQHRWKDYTVVTNKAFTALAKDTNFCVHHIIYCELPVICQSQLKSWSCNTFSQNIAFRKVNYGKVWRALLGAERVPLQVQMHSGMLPLTCLLQTLPNRGS